MGNLFMVYVRARNGIRLFIYLKPAHPFSGWNVPNTKRSSHLRSSTLCDLNLRLQGSKCKVPAGHWHPSWLYIPRRRLGTLQFILKFCLLPVRDLDPSFQINCTLLVNWIELRWQSRLMYTCALLDHVDVHTTLQIQIIFQPMCCRAGSRRHCRLLYWQANGRHRGQLISLPVMSRPHTGVIISGFFFFFS